MSTTDNTSATPGTPFNTSRTQPFLPQFESIRSDHSNRRSVAESSTSGSRWSTADRQSPTPSNLRANSSHAGSDEGNRDRPLSTFLPRRHKNRSSGGFLLEPTTHSSRLSRTILSRSHENTKGKRKSDYSTLSVSKRRTTASASNGDSQVPTSPYSLQNGQELNGQQHYEDDGGLSERHDNSRDTPNGFSGTPVSQRSATPSAGLDTDSAQIVDMALRLTEARRRQISGNRIVSSGTPGRRLASSSSSHPPQTPSRSFDQYVTSSTAEHASPLPVTSVREFDDHESHDSLTLDGPLSPYAPKQPDQPTDNEYGLSKATLARVERARIYLELAYEHRRLLSHLPPLRDPELPASNITTEPESKVYNPLQYARNRKLRIRERSAINAEVEGWHDVEKVRAWVDAVINSHSETSHDPLECVRLPPLSLRDRDDKDGQDSDRAYNSPPTTNRQIPKPRRPKSDWVTHPGDLIADAFWLEQGLNKTKIQDRDNNPIYPPDTQFKFSGWRNRTPIEIPQSLQQPTPPPETPSSKNHHKSIGVAPQLPTFRSAHRKDSSRGRRRSKLKNSIAKAQSDSRKRALGLLDSSSESDSDTSSEKSDKDGMRGRMRYSSEFDLPNGDPFAKPITASYQENKAQRASDSGDYHFAGDHLKRSSAEQSRLLRILKRNSVLKPSSHERGRSRDEARRGKGIRSSRDIRDDDRLPRSSAEYDTTSPNSPINYGLPSIAINLDAPHSRSPSPTKKSKSGFFHSLKERPKNLMHEHVETTDFARRPGASHSRNASTDTGNRYDSSSHTSRGTSPLARATSPMNKTRRFSMPQEEAFPSAALTKSNTISRVSTRSAVPSSQEQSSRIRGIFKGGRIAELVGNEVSRVGEYIWKRDPPPSYRHPRSGSESSFPTFDASDTDEEMPNGSVYKTPSHNIRPSLSAQSSTGGRRSIESYRSVDKPQLHNPNLPSFTSPFQRDRERQDKRQDLLKPGGETDHISRQVANHRARSKSPRLDRLAPPKLEITTPQPVKTVERKGSYGFGDALVRSQSASRLFNDAISTKRSNYQSTKTSTATLSNPFRKSMASSLDLNGSDGVTKRDISRVEAMLLISAVKAKNISASYQKIPSTRSGLLDGLADGRSKLPQARRRDEYVLAARQYIDMLGDQSGRIEKQFHDFSDQTIANLHRDIQIVEDQIENSITPRVRIAADNAGELSVRLTTTSTQAVKNVHDLVGEAFRLRRRGPFRWVRSLTYGVIEWVVVGLLWFIWAVVTVIRIFIGGFRGTVHIIRWLLWID